MNELAQALRLWRKSVGLTQEELAARLNVSRERYANWELGRATPPTDVQIQLAQLGMKVIPGMSKTVAAVFETRSLYGDNSEHVSLLLDLYGDCSQSDDVRVRVRAQLNKLLHLVEHERAQNIEQ